MIYNKYLLKCNCRYSFLGDDSVKKEYLSRNEIENYIKKINIRIKTIEKRKNTLNLLIKSEVKRYEQLRIILYHIENNFFNQLYSYSSGTSYEKDKKLAKDHIRTAKQFLIDIKQMEDKEFLFIFDSLIEKKAFFDSMKLMLEDVINYNKIFLKNKTNIEVQPVNKENKYKQETKITSEIIKSDSIEK